MTFFRSRVFADVTTLEIELDWGRRVEAEAGIGVTRPQAKEFWWPPREARDTLPGNPLREPAWLAPGFWFCRRQNLGEDLLC